VFQIQTGFMHACFVLKAEVCCLFLASQHVSALGKFLLEEHHNTINPALT
jgi:hypothetical protein